MPKIPHGERAALEIEKLENYCLDPTHPHGRHKARVFRSVLGIDRADAEWLRQILLRGAHDGDALEMKTDEFGKQWRLDIVVARQDRRAVVRTIWMIRTGEDFPRFITCWVL